MIKALKNDKFLRGSLLITAAGLCGSFFNYLIHPILMRQLSVSEYGDFQVLLSYAMLLAILNTVVITTTAKETTVLKANNQENRLEAFRSQLTYKVLLATSSLLFLLLFVNIFIVKCLKISSYPVVVIMSFVIIFGPLISLNRGILQGLQKFSYLAASNFLDPFLRFICVLILVVALSFGLFGAVSSSILSLAFSFAFTCFLIKLFIHGSSEGKYDLSIFLKYSFLVFLVNLGIMSLFNLDIFVAKYYLDNYQAGFYASLTTIGRIIYFLGSAISIIMFPVIAGEAAKRNMRKYRVLVKSIVLMLLFTIPAAIFFCIFPDFTIRLLAGSKYIAVAPYLPYFTVSLFLLIVIQTISQYFLALGNRKIAYILLSGVLVEIVILSFNHESILSIITSVIITFVLVIIALFLYLSFSYRVDKRNYIREVVQ